jgi:pimeloyl-ACP methyl ester carboxylesterase
MKNLNYFRIFIFILFLLFFFIFCSFSLAIHEQGEFDYTKTPVFFVHGYGCTADYWQPMISYLKKFSYPPEYLKAIQLYPSNGSNIEAAEKQIAPAIEELLESINKYLAKEHSGIRAKLKVDLVSHSMGAASARWYAVRVHPDRVRVWLSLAGANHGTDALCEYSGKGADEMCPAYARRKGESLIQYLLNGAPNIADVDETPYGIGKDSPGVNSVFADKTSAILYVTIRLPQDRWIKPEDSAVLDGSGGVSIPILEKMRARETSSGNILISRPVGHDRLIKDLHVMELVKNILFLEEKMGPDSMMFKSRKNY